MPLLRAQKELERRLALLLAQSFQQINYLRWSPSSATEARLSFEVQKEDCELFVLDYQGSALVKLDGEPYWSLDGYHRSIPLPRGKHEILAEFTPYQAFGEHATIFPGNPVIVLKVRSTFQYWQLASMALQLALKYPDPELKDDLFSGLSASLKDAYFEGITVDQLKLAKHVSESFPRELEQVVPSSAESLGYRVDTNLAKCDLARKTLEQDLEKLVTKYGKRGKLVATGHGHIDTAWLWPFEETEKKVARTFSIVLTMMDRAEKKFSYIQSMGLYYEWTKKQNSYLFQKIKERVSEGWWQLGAGWVEPDCNMLSGESFARQLLYSQQFYEKEFGKKADVFWLPDSFGFAASLPQIAKLGGVGTFATHKVFWNDTNQFPYSVFEWEGIDGTRLPAIAFGHGKDGYNSGFVMDELLEQWRNWADKDYPMLYSFGYGDGGGGPTEDMLLRAEAVQKLPILPRVSLGGLDELTKQLGQPSNLWRGELYLETHRAVLTSHSKMKLLNRRAEVALRDAELWTTIAGIYDKEKFGELWKILLKHQFHDVLPGSAIKEVYLTAYSELEQVIREANESFEKAAQALVGNGNSLLIFNSLPWTREEYVELPVKLEGSQQTKEGYLSKVGVPSVGYAKARSVPTSEKAQIFDREDHFLLENSFFILKMGHDGMLLSLFDKETKREVLKAQSNQLIFYENIPGWADAWDLEKGYETTSFETELVESKILEAGPLRVSLVLTRKFRHSKVTQKISLWADSRRIDFETTTDLHDRELFLKAWFHFDLNTDTAAFDIPFGTMERKTSENTSWEKARFEVPMQKWADLSETDYGVALLNNGKYGIAARGTSLGLSIAKTPIYPDPEADGETNTFTFSLYPHLGTWLDSHIFRRANELNVPLRVIKGRSSSDKSFLSIETDDLMLEAIKGSEDERSIVLRCYEVGNRRGETKIRLWKNVAQVEATNFLEERVSDREKKVESDENNLKISYRNYEICTIKLEFDSNESFGFGN
jgi:alpha-mannosidase